MPARRKRRNARRFKFHGAHAGKTVKKTAKKKSPRPRLEGYLYVALGAAVAALLLGNRGFRSMLSSFFHLRGVRAEIESLKVEEKTLGDSIDAMRSDDIALERAARRIGLSGPGEIEYRFDPPKPESD